MSEYYNGLSSMAKSRYKEKLQAVAGLTIDDDPYMRVNQKN